MARTVRGSQTVPGSVVGVTGYFLREAFRRIWVSKRTSLGAIGMIAVSLLILGAFLLVAENMRRAVDRWQARSKLTVYLHTDVTEEQIAAVDRLLRSAPSTANRQFVSRETAVARFKEMFSSLSGVVDELDTNPFPPSFEIEVTQAGSRTLEFEKQVSVMRRMPGVEDIQFDWEWAQKLRRLVGIIEKIGFVTGGLLALAAAFMIANVIRLTMFLYRDEVEIMRLVGATERIVRGPFVVEGLLQGAMGGLLALGLLYGGFVICKRAINPSSALIWNSLLIAFLPWKKALILVGGGMLAGLIGSLLSLRDHPRESLV